jgi:hypothetical protein
MSHACPATWTGTIALVRGVISRSRVATSSAAIGEHRPGAEVRDDLARRGERVGGHDHLVAGLEADRFERQMERRRARVDGDRVPGAHVRRERRLELAHHRARREPAGSQRADDLRDLGLTDRRHVERDRTSCHA